MKIFIFVLSFLLAGCATSMTAMTPEAQREVRDQRFDWAYVDSVNALARSMGVDVIWKEFPLKKDKRPATKNP